MPGRHLFSFLLLLGLPALAPAQAVKVITVRLIDGKTGASVTPDNLHVRFKTEKLLDAEWVKQNEDGTSTVKVPAGATSISLHATYDNSMEFYVNCDERRKGPADQGWYPVAEILSAGTRTPNGCSGNADKFKVDLKPGEFVLFVRKRGWRDGSQD
jgi:hypothetical protein